MTIRMKALVLMIGVSLLVSCEKKTDEKQQPRPVLSTIVKETPAATLRLAGTVEAKTETQLAFRVLGRLIARNVSVGDLVRKGDIVAAIDPLSLELAVRSTQSELSSAQAQQINARTTEQRQRTLLATNSGTESALEQAEQGMRSATAAVAKAQATLDKTSEQLTYAQLRAEFDGVVTATSAEVGQVVSPGQLVITIARPDERDAIIDVPQSQAARMKIGDAFEVSLQLDPTIKTRGAVREIAPEADNVTRTRRSKISLINPPDAFRLGSVVNTWAVISPEPQIVLPSSAILKTDKFTGIWIVDPYTHHVKWREVTIDGSIKTGDSVLVRNGLTAGERVVTAGVNKLLDGQSVRIEEEISQ